MAEEGPYSSSNSIATELMQKRFPVGSGLASDRLRRPD
jgi:hypothetical protein